MTTNGLTKLKTIVPVLFLLMLSWVLFNLLFFLGTNPTHLIDATFQKIFQFLWHRIDSIVVRDFLIFGLLTGIGGFLVYVPNILLMFFFSHLLFESNCTSYVARIIDPFFRLFGLNGHSFTPLLFGFGCSVGAIQNAQYIKNPKNRLLTLLIAPFMSCGSKFAVYIVLISIIFPTRWAGTVLFCLYAMGICFALVSSVILRILCKLNLQNDTDTAFEQKVVLQKPSMLNVSKKTLTDGWIFIKKAGSVIVIASLVIWALSYWPGVTAEQYQQLEIKAQQEGYAIPSRLTLSYHTSYMAQCGQFIEPVFKPLGQDWKSSVALLSSLAGRGIIISTLITLYGIDYSPQGSQTLAKALTADKTFSKLSGMSLMIFVLLCGSCLASITMFYSHTKSIGYTILFMLYPIASAWVISVLFYQIGLKWFVV